MFWRHLKPESTNLERIFPSCSENIGMACVGCEGFEKRHVHWVYSERWADSRKTPMFDLVQLLRLVIHCIRVKNLFNFTKRPKDLESKSSMSQKLRGGNSKNWFFHPYLEEWSNLTSIFFKLNGLKAPTSKESRELLSPSNGDLQEGSGFQCDILAWELFPLKRCLNLIWPTGALANPRISLKWGCRLDFPTSSCQESKNEEGWTPLIWWPGGGKVVFRVVWRLVLGGIGSCYKQKHLEQKGGDTPPEN